ncbi:MAG: hypothetical protein ACOH2E_08180 [Candidatus Paracaedibacter sp.]
MAIEEKIGEINRRHNQEKLEEEAKPAAQKGPAGGNAHLPKKPDRPKHPHPHKRPHHGIDADGSDEGGVGFGADVPAFMLRAVDLQSS